MLRFPLALALALVLIMSGAAQAASAASIELKDPWARASAMANGAAYAEILNKGKTDDALTEIESSKADKVEIHEMKMDGTVMRMRRLDRLMIPAGSSARLAPGGLHIMLIGLKMPLKDGETLPLTLSFEHGGKIEAEFPVMGKAPSMESGMDHMH